MTEKETILSDIYHTISKRSWHVEYGEEVSKAGVRSDQEMMTIKTKTGTYQITVKKL